MNLVSLVVPVYNEAENIEPLLRTIESLVTEAHETLIVYDFEEDSTVPVARRLSSEVNGIRLIRNDLGRGVLFALQKGFASASGDVVCVVMADLSDDISQIDQLAASVRAGAAVVTPSRYMKGGEQVGGPFLKRNISRLAGISLHMLTGIGTHDPTNNFKAYARSFLDEVQIESGGGFEIALELSVKAHLLGREIREIPTKWVDRTSGESRFRLLKWLPSYLRWYGRCILGTWSRSRTSRIPQS